MRLIRSLRLIAIGAVFILSFAAQSAMAQCESTAWENASYSVCTFISGKSDIRLFLDDPDGTVYGSFNALSDALERDGEKLVFAMNAGMYHPDYRPVGLFIESGVEKARLNTRNGPGNFHLKPNGVFYVTRTGAGVVDSDRFASRRADVRYATQSGPMLVINGRLHPRIQEEGTSKKTRNGVGACSGGRIVFAISNEPVTFYDFATFFRDKIGCSDALFLDGSISSMYAPSISRHDRWRPMGPIVGVVEKKKG
ncbi:MAG: hypothetical protein BGP04_22975 [Rhizobiales bacterium 62-17]|nr:phosphodiester glycosidase family protein [Hyphomicrobiales bacterium]OJY00436.1 MAG: hypothetical protein BGP04_22975 [Rhizobiales bacterium 62-17]